MNTDYYKVYNDACAFIMKTRGTLDSSTFFQDVYFQMFGKFPHRIDLTTDGKYMFIKKDDEDETIPYKFKVIKINETYKKIIENNEDVAVIRNADFPILVFKDTMIAFDDVSRDFNVFCAEEYLPKYVEDNVVIQEDDEEKHKYFDYIVNGANGFDTYPMEVENTDIDLNLNYNDDLPHEDIVKFLNGDQSGIVILHGEPGTGKSYYITHLMNNISKPFVYLDPEIFNAVTVESLLALLADYKNGVVIVEDCEELLAKRLTVGSRGNLHSILNFTAGALAHNFKLKFVFTYNASNTEIDPALKRKGRLKKMYKFEKLTKDKTAALANVLGKVIKNGESLTLADLYNYDENVGVETKHRGSGF